MKIELQKLSDYCSQGYLSKSEHPDYPLDIYKYTSKTVYEKFWNEITIQCRGLVVERDTGEIIAKPFPKFFNYDDEGQVPPEGLKYDIFSKIDGSLIIGFFYDNKWIMTTMGTFNSFQAQIAQELFDKNLKENFEKGQEIIPKMGNLTFLFELISPNNINVIDYGEAENLILLSIFNRKLGIEVTRKYVVEYANSFGCPFVEQVSGTLEELPAALETLPADREGFVVKWENGFRQKFKGKAYKELHALKGTLSLRFIAEICSNGQLDQEWFDSLPEHFKFGVKNKYIEYFNAYCFILNQIDSDIRNLEETLGFSFSELTPEIRKFIGLAIYSSKCELKHPSMIFPRLLGKNKHVDFYTMNEAVKLCQK